MATNKNALLRYQILEKLLTDRYHYYNIHDLTDKVGDVLYDKGIKPVGQRCIEKDLVSMQYEFGAPIEHENKQGKKCIFYSDKSFSIFNDEMSNEERALLHEVLSTIGQFDGLDNFTWLEKFKIGLGLEERKQVIYFSNNPYLKNSNLLGKLFDMISNEVVIKLSYHTFGNETIRSIDFHPYMLKQYNDRWYLIGAADSDMKILTFALDRIDEVETLPERKYIECPIDLSEHFEDIVGVTLYEDKVVEHILCWVSDLSKGYIITKPIHGSFTPIKGDKEQILHKEFPLLQEGLFFTLDCINNFELIRELCSFGKELIVLRSDGSVADDVYNRINEMNKRYSLIRTSSSQ